MVKTFLQFTLVSILIFGFTKNTNAKNNSQTISEKRELSLNKIKRAKKFKKSLTKRSYDIGHGIKKIVKEYKQKKTINLLIGSDEEIKIGQNFKAKYIPSETLNNLNFEINRIHDFKFIKKKSDIKAIGVAFNPTSYHRKKTQVQKY